MKPEISLVIPIYNEEENISPLVEEVLSKMKDFRRPFEVLLIDDGSQDKSWELLQNLARQHQEVRAFRFRRNFGQALAMQCGFDHAQGDLVVPLDGDGQNDPSDIPKMVHFLEEHNLDVVSGWRRKRKDHWLRSFLSRCANWLIAHITGVKIHDYGCSLKVYRREILQEIRLYGEMHRFIPLFLHARGAKIQEVEVHHRPRQRGTSKYGLNRTFKVIVDLFSVLFLIHYFQKPSHFFGKWLGILGGLSLLFLILGLSFSSLTLPCFTLSLFFGQGAWMAFFFIPFSEVWLRIYWANQHPPPYALCELVE